MNARKPVEASTDCELAKITTRKSVEGSSDFEWTLENKWKLFFEKSE